MDSQNAALGERWITPQEVADHLHIPLSTLHYWRRTNRGPRAVRIGRNLRYRPEEVRRWSEAEGSWT